jgi:hypothetical protein
MKKVEEFTVFRKFVISDIKITDGNPKALYKIYYNVKFLNGKVFKSNRYELVDNIKKFKKKVNKSLLSWK